MTHKLRPMIKKQTNMYRFCGIALLSVLVAACGGSSGGSSDDGGISGTGDPLMTTADSTQTPVAENPAGNTDAGVTGNSESTTTNTDAADTDTGGNTVTAGEAGLLATATPQFEWTAVDGADRYRLVLTEAEGNQITFNASTDVCSGTSCSASPTAAFHHNSIEWQVDAMSGNEVLQSAANGSYTTPRSFTLTPETSNPSVCSIWPSVSYDDVIVLNNIWNARQVNSTEWTQSIAATESDTNAPVASWDYNWLTETDGDRTAVKAYPEIFYGNKLGTHESAPKAVTGLPETVTSLPEFSVDFAFTETFDGDVERNVALESFFHDSCDITGPCDLEDNRAYEMMVWVVNPESNRPGDLALTGVMIDNRLWDVYIKPRSDKKYIAFTAQTPFDEGTLQWNRFVEWTVQWTGENAESLGINALTPDLCMAAIEMGTELWWGKGTFTLDRFNVTKNP